MKKTDLAYTAGIIDGEGCIYIAKATAQYNKLRPRYGLFIKVASTDEWLCQWLKFAWGGSIILIPNHSRNTKWSDAWNWTIQTNQALLLLKAILPYLRLKRPQAELAIQFQERKRQRNQYSPNNSEFVVEEAEYILMKSMKHNKRKPPRVTPYDIAMREQEPKGVA